jgi:hypothetical protein
VRSGSGAASSTRIVGIEAFDSTGATVADSTDGASACIEIATRPPIAAMEDRARRAANQAATPTRLRGAADGFGVTEEAPAREAGAAAASAESSASGSMGSSRPMSFSFDSGAWGSSGRRGSMGGS